MFYQLLSQERELYKKMDNIHDPAIYDIAPEDDRLILQEDYLTKLRREYDAQQAIKNSAEKADVHGSVAQTKWEWVPPWMHNQENMKLKQKIAVSHKTILKKIKKQDQVQENSARIVPLTQANNKKRAEKTIEEERQTRADILAEQIKAWRSLLPKLLAQFSVIPDYRKATRVEHKITTLLIFGLFAFVLKLESRREMNDKLTAPCIQTHLKKLFPDLETIPHADTLARFLKKTNPLEIEKAHIELIKDLIRNKKFKKLLINNCLPISIDGSQKLYRDGLLHDGRWSERNVGNDNEKQQYVYVIEANITLKNGLNIPLMTEFLFRDNNKLTNPEGKEDCELVAFERMAERIKQYFPRLKLILLMDSLYATHGVMELCQENNWEFMITLPNRKLKDLYKALSANKNNCQEIPEQPYYRGRHQTFYWENNIYAGLAADIHVVGCLEKYETVDKKTGEIQQKHSEHTWISSIPLSILTVHELCNLGARKEFLIEDSFNTEKNRGYKYEHAFSYDWYGMQGFHYLMRMAHAINALSQFTRKLKKFIKANGVSSTLKLIKETLCSPWLPVEWYESQLLEVPQLQLE